MASIRSLATAALLGNVYAGVVPVKRAVPALAQVINQKALNVLPKVPPAVDYNASSVGSPSAPPVFRKSMQYVLTHSSRHGLP